ncbi:MAG: hypothetical protein ACMG6S_30315, partial [Byssovorax sp.]
PEVLGSSPELLGAWTEALRTSPELLPARTDPCARPEPAVVRGVVARRSASERLDRRWPLRSYSPP